jgi:hypothetical protein
MREYEQGFERAHLNYGSWERLWTWSARFAYGNGAGGLSIQFSHVCDGRGKHACASANISGLTEAHRPASFSLCSPMLRLQEIEFTDLKKS